MSTLPVENMLFKTREASSLQKLYYWPIPPSWLLDEFRIEGGKLTVVRKNGDRFEAQLTDVEATLAVDGFDRREINIRCGEKRTRFKKIPGMLSNEEWNAIIAVLSPFEAQKSQIVAAEPQRRILGMRPNFAAVVAVLAAAAFVLCLFFHIVPDSLTVFPKEHPTFADTFIDVTDYVKRYNDADLITKISMKQSYIFRKLEEKGLIVKEHDEPMAGFWSTPRGS